MRKHHRWFIMAGVMLAAGCSDRSTQPTAPPSPNAAATEALTGPPSSQGVAAVGVVIQVDAQGQTLVLLQTGLELVPGKGVTVAEERRSVAIGSRDANLGVLATPETKVYLKGQERTFADLEPGAQVIVVGRAADGNLQATAITDLTPVDPPPGVRDATRQRLANLVANPRPTSRAAAAEVMLCNAQDLDYPDTDVLEFQGCWGGPLATDNIDVDVGFLWVLLGYLKIDYISYEAGLSGYGFAYPFRFTAEAPSGLVYHVPSVLSLGVQGLPALPGSFTFAGGMGVDLGINIDFCTNFGECSDLETFHVGAGQIFESTEPGPTDPATHVDIEEPTCLGVGVLPIKGFSPLTVSWCFDLGWDGRPFHASVRAGGTRPLASQAFAFESGTTDMSVRPDSTAVRVRFHELKWGPRRTMGGYVMFDVFSFEVYRTPDLFNNQLEEVTFIENPFPAPLSPMTLARSRSGEPLYQPTYIDMVLPVAPAPTQLTITSGQGLADGMPVSVRLGEAHDQSAIAGQTVTIQANGVGGTPSIAVPVTTDATGIATLVLPVGEYDIVALYDGAPMYLPTSAQMSGVFVFRPTMFVIWGGNTGGIVTGSRVQFWGRGWSNQVHDGAYGGNASFQGFAIPVSETIWASPPASSGHGPATIPDLIAVIVTTNVEGRGSNTVGNIAGHAVLRVDEPSSYARNGGHPATGVILRMLP